ncbi:MAG: hypothetical protein AAB780_00455 [Patescibacteria group bacterium]
MIAAQDYDNTLVRTASSRRQTIAGPSREELFDSLRLSTANSSRQVAFTVAASHITGKTLAGEFVPSNLMFYAVVIMLRPEDGSGNNWLFELRDHHHSLGIGITKLRGYINTTTRQGWVEPVID